MNNATFEDLMKKSSCDNPLYLFAILSRHAISKKDYDDWVNAHFGGRENTPKMHPIRELIPKDVDCKKKCWYFTASDGENESIKFKLDDIPKCDDFTADGIDSEITSRYSLQLFRGLLHWFSAAEIHLTLANKGSIQMIIFLAQDASRNVVYYGNITNLFPLIGEPTCKS